MSNDKKNQHPSELYQLIYTVRDYTLRMRPKRKSSSESPDNKESWGYKLSYYPCLGLAASYSNLKHVLPGTPIFNSLEEAREFYDCMSKEERFEYASAQMAHSLKIEGHLN